LPKPVGKGSDPQAKHAGVTRKLIEFDAETWHALRLLSGTA
jgi:hypothetical protein